MGCMRGALRAKSTVSDIYHIPRHREISRPDLRVLVLDSGIQKMA